MNWKKAIAQPGADQMQHARALLESRPFCLAYPINPSSFWIEYRRAVPGSGRYRFVATRDEEGAYAMVYVPVGRSFKVKMETISGDKVNAWWFNPRTGEANLIGSFPNRGEQEFVSPDYGELLDWVLVLDDAAKNYPAPGKTKQ